MIFSLQKLLVLAGVAYGAWQVYRFFERRGEGIKQDSETRDKDAALDMEECSVCRAWVSGDPCGREACPFGG